MSVANTLCRPARGLLKRMGVAESSAHGLYREGAADPHGRSPKHATACFPPLRRRKLHIPRPSAEAEGLTHFAHRSDCFSARQPNQYFMVRAVERQKATLTVTSSPLKFHGLCGAPVFRAADKAHFMGFGASPRSVPLHPFCSIARFPAPTSTCRPSLYCVRGAKCRIRAAKPVCACFAGAPPSELARRAWRQLRCRPGFAPTLQQTPKKTAPPGAAFLVFIVFVFPRSFRLPATAFASKPTLCLCFRFFSFRPAFRQQPYATPSSIILLSSSM